MKNIGISNLPNIIHTNISKNQFNFNIIVAGPSGTGKTKFIQYLMQTKLKQSNPTLFFEKDFKKSVSATSKKITNSNLFLDFEEYKFKLEDKGIKTNIKIVEISNIGDSVDNTGDVEPIINFLEKEYESYYTLEKINCEYLIKDNRIHLFLYFFDALSPRAIDIKILNTINYYVNVVPCCAFSDILTKEERTVILQSSIYKKMKFFNKTPIQFVCEPRRSYVYGKSTNEFLFMKDFLKDNLLKLIDSTKSYYESYKRKKIIMDVLKKYKGEVHNEDLIFLKKFIETEEKNK